MAAVTPSSRTPMSDAPPVSSGFSVQLVESAAGRVAWLAPVACAVIVFVQVFQAFTQPAMTDVVMRPGNRLASLATVLLGIAIFALHRLDGPAARHRGSREAFRLWSRSAFR